MSNIEVINDINIAEWLDCRSEKMTIPEFCGVFGVNVIIDQIAKRFINMLFTQKLLMDDEMLVLMGYRGSFGTKVKAFLEDVPLLQIEDFFNENKHIIFDINEVEIIFDSNPQKFSELSKKLMLVKAIMHKYSEYDRLFEEHSRISSPNSNDLLKEDFEMLKQNIELLKEELTALAHGISVCEGQMHAMEEELVENNCHLKIEIDELNILKQNLDKKIRDTTRQRKRMLKYSQEFQRKRLSLKKSLDVAKKQSNNVNRYELELKSNECARKESILMKKAHYLTTEVDALINRLIIYTAKRATLSKREDDLVVKRNVLSQIELNYSRKSWIFLYKSNIVVYKCVLCELFETKLNDKNVL